VRSRPAGRCSPAPSRNQETQGGEGGELRH
jgi:hypothetical protein